LDKSCSIPNTLKRSDVERPRRRKESEQGRINAEHDERFATILQIGRSVVTIHGPCPLCPLRDCVQESDVTMTREDIVYQAHLDLQVAPVHNLRIAYPTVFLHDVVVTMQQNGSETESKNVVGIQKE